MTYQAIDERHMGILEDVTALTAAIDRTGDTTATISLIGRRICRRTQFNKDSGIRYIGAVCLFITVSGSALAAAKDIAVVLLEVINLSFGQRGVIRIYRLVRSVHGSHVVLAGETDSSACDVHTSQAVKAFLNRNLVRPA